MCKTQVCLFFPCHPSPRIRLLLRVSLLLLHLNSSLLLMPLVSLRATTPPSTSPLYLLTEHLPQPQRPRYQAVCQINVKVLTSDGFGRGLPITHTIAGYFASYLQPPSKCPPNLNLKSPPSVDSFPQLPEVAILTPPLHTHKRTLRTENEMGKHLPRTLCVV